MAEPELTDYFHKGCGGYVLTKRGGAWKRGEHIKSSDVINSTVGKIEYGRVAGVPCDKCGGFCYPGSAYIEPVANDG